jgi:hypothetical protein
MAFELSVLMRARVDDLRSRWQDEINAQGFHVEIMPSFRHEKWAGGFLPIKIVSMPQAYLFGLQNVTQLSGFEVDFQPQSAHFRSGMGRTVAELVMQCYGAATLAVITNGVYHDPQTGDSFEGAAALERAHLEILDYAPYIDDRSKRQHAFTRWSDYTDD